MPRKTIRNEGDAMDVLAGCIVKLSKNPTISGNDLHAINTATETFLFGREVDRMVRAREETKAKTGLDKLDLDIEMHRTLKRLQQGIADRTSVSVTVPRKKSIPALAKPQTFRDAEAGLARDARTQANAIPRFKHKVRPKPRRNTGV